MILSVYERACGAHTQPTTQLPRHSKFARTAFLTRCQPWCPRRRGTVVDGPHTGTNGMPVVCRCRSATRLDVFRPTHSTGKLAQSRALPQRLVRVPPNLKPASAPPRPGLCGCCHWRGRLRVAELEAQNAALCSRLASLDLAASPLQPRSCAPHPSSPPLSSASSSASASTDDGTAAADSLPLGPKLRAAQASRRERDACARPWRCPSSSRYLRAPASRAPTSPTPRWRRCWREPRLRAGG